MRSVGFRFFLILLLTAIAGAQGVRAGNIVVTEPLVRYGLGNLAAAAHLPNGKTIATASEAGVYFWDAVTGEHLRTLDTQDLSVRSLAFSPEGSLMAMGGSEPVLVPVWERGNIVGWEERIVPAVKVWDISEGGAIGPSWSFSGGGLAFSPDGRRLLGASSGEVYIARTLTGDPIDPMTWPITQGVIVTIPAYGTSAAVFSPDGATVLRGDGNGRVKFWDSETGAELGTLPVHDGRVLALALSADGTRLLTGSDDRTAKLWDMKTSEVIHTFVGHGGRVGSVALSADGTKVVTGSDEDASVRVWNAETGKTLVTLLGHTGPVWSLSFSPTSRQVLTVGSDQTVRLWNPTNGALVRG